MSYNYNWIFETKQLSYGCIRIIPRCYLMSAQVIRKLVSVFNGIVQLPGMDQQREGKLKGK